jgi:hypothetical protein
LDGFIFGFGPKTKTTCLPTLIVCILPNLLSIVLWHPSSITSPTTRSPTADHNKARSKLILCVGTAMNSGKTHAAAASCYALSSMGKSVRAAKITGVASLKDI